ncbi:MULTISPECIES: hypothetical protein [unclassified Mesorhizobium]|nr:MULTISPECIES: hypothetical protein [unclassified Mesorhizobium]RUW74573.1 hypothetical protein EOA29_30510 [Mesorhizobium sp. M1E.F.Ca.ET.063.01.1.1]AZO24551.1 hypothetical protein EJ070_30290 [Mesorhizobium sp. M1E.F.Ca.ET.045.02.1.1]RUW33697.1 hypothetical protein EOA38_12395 [Mesorhizobium sp. M1E.F.Ca.ET.041.01.1.1]RWB52844.1 MAG: hypothetical protein EOQ47_23820 [Mesorhizobium sp.]RWD80640.1 MAG: hypothetical protein EOS38_29980 [Mesorhizobium sp.]
MGPANFAQELLSAADRTGEMSGSDLKALLRRAALVLRNAGDLGMEADIEEALDGAAAEMRVSKAQLLQSIAMQWLIANSHIPLYKMDDWG